jgi:hypothetical protein
MPVFGTPPNRGKFRTYAWSLGWMLCQGKTEEQAVASLKRRFKWLSDDVIAAALNTARQWMANSDKINASWKAAEIKEQG